MANSTADVSVSPATGLALYGLLELFLRQPNVAVAVYAFATITHIMPQHLSTYDAAAAMVENYFHEPQADDLSEASQSSGDDTDAQYDPPNASARETIQTSQSFVDYITLKYDQYRSLFAVPKPNAWLLASLTWLVLISIHRNYIQAHGRRQRYSSPIVSFAYAAVVAYLAASERPWEVLKSLWDSFHTLTIHLRLKLTGNYAQAFTTGWYWVEWYTDYSKTRATTSAIIGTLIQTLLLIVVFNTALGDFIYHCVRDPMYMRARIAHATRNVIQLPHSLCLMILRFWLFVNEVSEQLLARWTRVESILVCINMAVAFGGVLYAQDALVSLVVQSLIVTGSLCYLYSDRVARGIAILRNATSRSIPSNLNAIAAFIDSVKGWLIFYAFIVHGIKAPVALNLVSRDDYSVANLWSSIPTFHLPQINDLTPDVDLQNKWSQLKLAVSTSLASYLEMRRDAKTCLDYIYSYMGWALPSTRESWAVACSYSIRPIASVFLWSWAMIKTLFTVCSTQASALFGQVASLHKTSQSAANQSTNASSGALFESFQDASTQSKFAGFTALSACYDKLSNCLTTIFGYASKIFWIVFHADSCPECSELYWSKMSVIIGTAIVTCACVAQYNLYPHATSQRFVFCFYLTVGLEYLLTLDCTQEIKAAVNTALIPYPLSCVMFHPDPFMDSVRRAYRGIMGFPNAMYATAEATCTKAMDAILGRVGPNDWTHNSQLWFPDDLDIWATDSDDSDDEEDLPAPSSVPSSVLSTPMVAIEEQPVDRTSVAEDSSAQKSETAAVRLEKWAYQRKFKVRRNDARLQRAIAETNALDQASQEMGPRPDFYKNAKSTSSTPDGTAENITDFSLAEAEADVPDQPSSQLEVPTQKHATTDALIAESPEAASVPIANETVDPFSTLPTETAENITDAAPAGTGTTLPALPAQFFYEIEVLTEEPAAATAPVQANLDVEPRFLNHETSEPASAPPETNTEEINNSSLDEVEAEVSEHPQRSAALTVQEQPQGGKSTSEFTFPTEPVIVAPAPASPPQVPTIALVPATPEGPVIAAPATASIQAPVIAAPAPASLQVPVIVAPATASSQEPSVAPALAPAEAQIPQTSVLFTNSDLQNTFLAPQAAVLATRADEDNSTLDDGSGETTTNASKTAPESNKMEGVEDAAPEPTNQAVAASIVAPEVDTKMDDAPEAVTIELNSTPAPAPAQQSTVIADHAMTDQESTHNAGPPVPQVTQKPLPSLQSFLSNAPPMPTPVFPGLQPQQQKSAWHFGLKASEPVLVSSTPVAPPVTAPAINTPAIPVTQPQQQNMAQSFSFGLKASQPILISCTPVAPAAPIMPPQRQFSFFPLGPGASQPSPLFGGFSTLPQQKAKPQQLKFDIQLRSTTPAFANPSLSPISGLQTTQNVANPTRATQTPGNDTDLTAENLAAAGALYDDAVHSQESDPSSLDTEARNNTAEGVRMLAAAYAERDAEAAVAASTPRSRSPSPQSPRPQSPTDLEREWENVLYADRPSQLEHIQEENDEDEFDFFDQTESARLQSNINNGLSVETIEDSDSDLSAPLNNLSEQGEPAAVEPNPKFSLAGRRPASGSDVNGPNADDEWDGTTTKQDPVPADRVIKPLKKGNVATPASAKSSGFGDYSTTPAPRVFKYSSPSSPSTPTAPTPPAPRASDVLIPAAIQAALTGHTPSQFDKYSNPNFGMMPNPKAPIFGAQYPSRQVKPYVPDKSMVSPSYTNSASPSKFSPISNHGVQVSPWLMTWGSQKSSSPNFTATPLTGTTQGGPYQFPGFNAKPLTRRQASP